MKFVVIIIALILPVLCYGDDAQFNPYHVLNVPTSASTGDIRKSYKKLVKEWHPDKNDSPNAQDKFIQIQQAYEILSNEEKRRQYDVQGFSSENNQQWTHNQPQHFKFSDFFGNDFYDFGFGEGTTSRSISTYKFFKQVLPDSHHTPQVLYVYSTFCAQCIVILKSSWERAAGDLEKLGLGVGTVDTTFTSRIAKNLRVTRIPMTVVIFKEHYSYYKGVISYESLKNFVTEQLPQHLVQTVSSQSVGKFINGAAYDDKPRSLLFSKQKQPTLLYTLMSIKHQKYIVFGFASLSDSDTKLIANKFGVKGHGPTLLVFKEDSNKPAIMLQSSDMPRGAVNEILTLHRYMTVPRITSQDVFNDVCPPPTDRTFHVHLCAIFVTNPKNPDYENSIRNLRHSVTAAFETEDQLADWLKFVFVVDSKQSAFVRSISGSETVPNKPAIYLVWRRATNRGFTSTFSAKFLESDKTVDFGFQKFLAVCLQTAHQRQFEREVRFLPIVNELAPYFITQLLQTAWKLLLSLLNMMYYLSEQEAMLLFITLIVVFLSMYSSFTNSNKRQRKRDLQQTTTETPPEEEEDVEVDVAYTDDEADVFLVENIPSVMVELTSSTYENLVLRQKRGHMTIVSLLDKSDHVLHDFVKIMKSHQIDAKLHFSYLKMTSYLSWYVELRKASSAEPPEMLDKCISTGLSSLHSDNYNLHSTELELNTTRAHGTVLAINGSKHWYCIFVPRVGRFRRQRASVDSSSSTTSSNGDATEAEVENGRTLHSSTVDAPEQDAPPSERVIVSPDGASDYCDSLMHWMDRVCEGQMPRLYVRQWPGLYQRTPHDSEDDE